MSVERTRSSTTTRPVLAEFHCNVPLFIILWGKWALRALGRVRSDLPHIRKWDENLWVTSKFDGLQVIFSMLHPPLTASRVNSCLYKQVEIDGTFIRNHTNDVLRSATRGRWRGGGSDLLCVIGFPSFCSSLTMLLSRTITRIISFEGQN